MSGQTGDLNSFISERVQKIRPKLLDLTLRNPLLSTRMTGRSAIISIVDTTLEHVWKLLGDGRERRMQLLPLPPLDAEPADEQSENFRRALAIARNTDETYLEEMTKAEGDDEKMALIERKLKDRLREQLGLAPRQSANDKISLSRHARNHNISPALDLPLPGQSGKLAGKDNVLQTLMLPDDLARRIKGLLGKSNTWEQETGVHVLQIALGFLQWQERDDAREILAPMLLMPIRIEIVKKLAGPEFWLCASGENAEGNFVLAERLRHDFNIDLPRFDADSSFEEYYCQMEEVVKANKKWSLKRQIIIGVFPSASMAMYMDLAEGKHDFGGNEVVKTLLGGSTARGASPFADDYDVDRPEIATKVPRLVMDADASQFSAIVDMADGKNIAVEGPPGTGKSQTIVNAIAAALDKGKKVLFVAEKMAALEVVKSRMEAVGLGEFILPLQAKRSSREDVVASIRRRVEMKTLPPPSQYEEKIKNLRSIRDRLGEYVELISSTYADTNIKVYDIIGKTIYYNALLSTLSSDMLTKDIKGIDEFTITKIDEIKNLSSRLLESKRNAQKSNTFWNGIGIEQLNPFVAKSILEKANNISLLMRNLIVLYESLQNIHYNKNDCIENIKISLDCLLYVNEHNDHINKELISFAAKSDIEGKLFTFIENYCSYQRKRKSLEEYLIDVDGKDSSAMLWEIYNFFNTHNIELMGAVQLNKEIAALSEEIDIKETLVKSILKFISIYPYAKNIHIGILKKLKVLLNETPRDVLFLKKGDILPYEIIELENLCDEGMQLFEKKDELAKFINVEAYAYQAAIAEHLATLKSAGIFRFFSPRYHAAKKFYMSITARDKYDKITAIKDMGSLLDYATKVQQFENNGSAAALFGIHFHGIQTKFALFKQLITFYKKLENILPGLDNRDFRRFVKNADLDILDLIPDFSDIVFENTVEELSDTINKKNNRLNQVKKSLDYYHSLETIVHRPAGISVYKLHEIVTDLSSLHAIQDEINNNARFIELLDAYYSNWKDDPDNLKYDRHILGLAASNSNFKKSLIHILDSDKLKIAIELLGNIIKGHKNIIEEKHGLEDMVGKQFQLSLSAQDISQFANFFECAAKDQAGLYAWSIYRASLNAYLQYGFDFIIDNLDEKAFDQIAQITEAVIYHSLARKVYARHGQKLARYHGEELDSLHHRLARLDQEYIELSRQYLKATLHARARPPQGNGVGKRSSWTDLSLIKNELSKKQRFLPARELINRAGQALLELKPCWMMSPQAVAQYLKHGDMAFDVCILDEASQMPPENALGALVRSRQAMIVGDTNQLPPTNFFRKNFGEEDQDYDQAVLEESILELANASFRPQRRLKWHYRSRHSALIQFSNHYIYDDDLVVFPSPSEARDDMGVSLIRVDGNYKAGINHNEALTMVRAALDFMQKFPNRSLGIVTLNQKQSDLLTEEMEMALASNARAADYIDKWNDKKDGLESFFIKNLENVQGDERDVIFVGTVYGPESPGAPVMQRFGPINGIGGKRRLNVLFTRAKEQLVTFSSMSPDDIKASEDKNPGAYMLKCWLEYAGAGTLPLARKTGREPESDFEAYVIAQLKAMGCETVPQIGAAGYRIDIGVRHPKWPYGYILGVECDGASYHSSRSARERDRLREQVLVGLGWKLYRIWSTSWFSDPVGEAQKLRQAIEDRLRELQRA